MRRVSFLLLLWPALVWAQQLTADEAKEVDLIATRIQIEHGIPGLSLAIARGGELAYEQGYGLADLENNVHATPDTMYRLASISKCITAVAAMQLAENGNLDLDAPVRKYAPDWPEKQWIVTTRLLLGHLGGVRHYDELQEVLSARHYASLASALDIFKDDPLLHEPGTEYSYSTYGYNLIGRVIEGASGDDFDEYIDEHIFEPAGMERIRLDDSLAIIEHRAQGYQRFAGGLYNSNMVDTSNKPPGGGLISTAGDLALFAIALMEGELVSDETRAAMWTSGVTTGGEETGYGYGFGISKWQGEPFIAHGGAQPRVRTFLAILPESSFAVAVMCNLEGAPADEIARQIATSILN